LGIRIAALVALLLALGAGPARAQTESYESLAGTWWFSLGGQDAGALLIQLSEPSFATYRVEDVELTGKPSFGFSRALGGFFLIAAGQTIGLDSRGNLVGELELVDPEDDAPVGVLELVQGKPSPSMARLALRGTVAGTTVPAVRVIVDGRRAPAAFQVLTGRSDAAQLGGQAVSSRSYDLTVRTNALLGVPAYDFVGTGPARIDRIEETAVDIAGRLMLGPNQRVYGMLDDSTHFGSGIAKGRLRVPTEGTVPKLDLELEADRQLRASGNLDEAVEGVLSVEPLSVDFGAVRLDASDEYVLSVENVGADALSGTAELASGSSSAFTLPDETSFSLAPGDPAFGLRVVFDPSAATTYSGEIVLRVAGGAGGATVTLTGVGGVAEIAVDPTAGDFPDVAVGDSATLDFTISNPGDGVLTGAATLTGSSDFAFSPTATSIDYSLDPESAETETIRVRFTPTATGSRTGTLVLTGGGGASVELSGVGTEASP
jgi:hypothetical protein